MIAKNSRKEEKGNYNCGGYALKTFTWVSPYKMDGNDDEKVKQDLFNFWDYMEEVDNPYDYKDDADDIAERLCLNMVRAFGGKLRMINRINEASASERVIAFRLGYDDFHYMIKGRKGHQWHSKMGSRCKIDTFSEDFVLNSDDWGTQYFSDTFLMALSV